MAEALPDFLVVGGQKCGTTTLYFDLLASPEIFFPSRKEPGNLARDEVLTPEGRRAYADLYRSARAGQRRGDASTVYTMGDNSPSCAKRAQAVLGTNIAVFYLVRDPIDRIRSHYRHRWSNDVERRPINTAVLEDQEYVANSSYARQLRPWRALFGDRVHVIRFEQFVNHRRETANHLADVLDIASFAAAIDPNEVHNASSDHRSLRGAWRTIQGSTAYQRVVRPLTSPPVRAAVRRLVLPRAPKPASDELSSASVEALVSRLADDLVQHQDVLGLETWTPKSLLHEHLPGN